MLSANGRHRRPRQAPALVVAVGVAGSAIAIPLLGASSAGAAEAETWDRVAECESAGMWSADLGNGYYGGLQFTQETWKDFGGTAYAPRADLASRSQQIQVAEKVFAEQGPQAWPSCSVISGLAKGDDTAPGDGATAEPTPSETPDSTEADASDKAERSAQPKADDSAEPADSSKPAEATEPPASEKPAKSPQRPADDSTPSTTPTAEESTPQGKHRGGKATEPTESAEASTGNTDESRESGRHASRGDGSTRDADGAAAEKGEYVVQAGDSLWGIADTHDVSGGWSAIYQANEGVVGSDADLIRPGQSLDLTPK